MVIFKKFKTKRGDEIILRRPKKSDLISFWKFRNELRAEDIFISNSPEDKKTLKEEKKSFDKSLKEVSSGNRVLIYVECNGKLIGTSSFKSEGKRSKHVWRFGLSISPMYRNLGIGTEMIKVGFELAKKKGAKIILLGVFAENKSALCLYEKFGMKECGRIPKALKYKNRYI